MINDHTYAIGQTINACRYCTIVIKDIILDHTIRIRVVLIAYDLATIKPIILEHEARIVVCAIS
jgi:hypothetical protein